MRIRVVIGVVVVALVAAAGAKSPAPDIRRFDQNAAATEPGGYPTEMVAPGQKEFDGSYRTATQHDSAGQGLTVAIWESGPGVLRTDGYPYDEYCLVLEGHLVVTNRSGTTEEFRPGDSFLIPKGWAGTWDMKTKFRKQYVVGSRPS